MKKRILCILLCLCMMTSFVAIFSSCSFGGSKTLEFIGYSVVYADDVSDSTASYIQSFADQFEKKVGNNIAVKKVSSGSSASDADAYEILVGNTNRKESAKALSKIKGHGYSISVVKDKVVIVGTTNLMTVLALNYFTDTYLKGEKSAELTIEKTVTSETEMVTLTEKYSFVYSSLLDGAGDFVNTAIGETKKFFETVCDVRGTAMPMIDDTKTAKNEILVGVVDRKESTAFQSGMDALDYGVGIKDGKVIIAGLGDTALGRAFALFRDVLRDSVVKVSDKKVIMLPASFEHILTHKKTDVFTDFPRPEGLSLSGSADVYDGSTEYYYTGKGATSAAYKSYCQSLVAAGYTLYGKETVVEDSIFRTYVNREKGATLYVAFNAYKHASAQKVTDFADPAIRIVAAKLNTVNLIDEDILAQDLSFTRLQNSSISNIRLYPVNDEGHIKYYGNLYVITLEDGSFVLMDGGRNTTASRDELYKTLLALYKEGHGGADPTENDPIRIAAWVVSHGHGDHTGVMVPFVDKYCKNWGNTVVVGGSSNHRAYVTVDRLIANFISDEEHYNDYNGNVTLRNTYAGLSAKISDAPGMDAGFKYIKVHTGQKFWLANVEFEIIHTHEDLFPNKIHIYNNASTVIRTNIYHTENGAISEGSKTSMLWLGDAQAQTSRSMRATYGATIHSDMMQYAHHGFDGCEWAFYQLVAPKCIWWPQGRDPYKAYINATKYKDDKTSAYGVNYQVSVNLKSVHYIILSYDYDYTMTILEDGANYAVYDATTEPYGVRNMSFGEDMAISGLAKVSSNVSTSYMMTKHNPLW